MPMKYWGVEVKARETLKIIPDCFKIIHVSQAALGEVKDVKGAISVPLHLKIGDKSYVIGNLSAEDRPQLMLDLVFEKQFELSHDWKRGSVYFAGYTADDPCISDGDDSDEEYISDEELDSHAIAKLKSKSKEDGVFNGDEAGDSDASDESTDISLENGLGPSFMDDSDFSNEDGSSDDSPFTDELITKRPSKSAEGESALTFISTSDEDDSDEEYSSDEELDIHAIAKLKSKSKEDGVFNGDEAGDSDASEESTDISLENGLEPSFMDDSDFSDEDGSSDDSPSTDELITKQPSKSTAEITVPAKKAKLSIPEKTGGKKGQAGNAASTGNKSKGRNQKSGKSSNKSFGSDTRKKARHGGK